MRNFSPVLKCGAMLFVLYVVTALIIHLSITTDFRVDNQLGPVKVVLGTAFFPLVFKFLLQVLSLPFYPLLEKRRELHQNHQSDQKVSVLIPAWNEEIGIVRTLTSVINSSYTNMEVVVINDGSTDKTDQLIARFIKNYEADLDKNRGPLIKYLKLPNGGKAKALNQGLKIASGEFVVTIDADSVMDKDMITNLLKRFTDQQVAAVAGNVIVGNRKRPIELLQQLEYLNGFCFKRADSNFNAVHIIGGAAAGYRKSSLEKVGGFDESIITEDVEISTRLLAHGYKTRYAANAVVYTEGPSDLTGLLSQRLRWKFGRLLTYYKHKDLFLSREKQHSAYLCWIVLPIALYVELMLILSPIMLTWFYFYTFSSQDFLPLVLMMSVVTGLVSLQLLADSKTRFHSNLFVFAPVAWLMFYLVDLVEYHALVKSLFRLSKNQELEWQTWSRVGIISRSVSKNVECSNNFIEHKKVA